MSVYYAGHSKVHCIVRAKSTMVSICFIIRDAQTVPILFNFSVLELCLQQCFCHSKYQNVEIIIYYISRES